jgi:hypothetical protein
VQGKGWTAVIELQPGDLLRGDDGQLYPVESVTATDEWLPVYNARIADYHTYFVCAPDGNVWLWAHNSCHLNNNAARSKFGIYEIFVNGKLHKVGKADMNRITKSSGLPTRLHQQIRKLEQVYGKANVTHSLTPLGRTTTRQAKLAEIARLQAYFDRTGIVPLGNIRSFFPQLR